MRPQQGMGIEIKGIVHRPRRMVRWNIERLEIAEIILDFRAFRHAKADASEQRFNAGQGATEWMVAARLLAASWQGHINAFGGQASIQRHRFQYRFTGRNGRFHSLFSVVNRLARCAALVWWQASQFLQLLGQYTFLAQIQHARLVKHRQISGAGNRSLGGSDEIGQGIHADKSLNDKQ